MRDVGAVSTTGLGTHGASALDADPVFRDGEQDVHRDGIRKEPALFQPDNKYRCIGAGITGIQLKIKVAVLCVFRLYALQLFLRQLKLGHVLQLVAVVSTPSRLASWACEI